MLGRICDYIGTTLYTHTHSELANRCFYVFWWILFLFSFSINYFLWYCRPQDGPSFLGMDMDGPPGLPTIHAYTTLETETKEFVAVPV